MHATATYSLLRFRRWSRASYAVFASLHKTVSIGCVSADIADASLSKDKHTAHIEYSDESRSDNMTEMLQSDDTSPERTVMSGPEEPSYCQTEQYLPNSRSGRNPCGFPDLFITHSCSNN